MSERLGEPHDMSAEVQGNKPSSQRVGEGSPCSASLAAAPERSAPPTSAASGVADLLARVEAATGPDRELDRLIVLATIIPEGPGVVREPWGDGSYTIYDNGRKMGRVTADEYTKSLDAALALVERVRPGWTWQLWWDARRMAVLIAPGHKSPPYFKATAATPPLALIAALLSATLDAGQASLAEASTAASCAETLGKSNDQ